MSTMKRNTVLTAAIAVALAGGVAQAAPQNLSQGTGFTIDNIGINSGNGLTAGFNAATAGAAAAADNPYAGGSVSNNVGTDAANGFVMNTVTDANGNKYIRTIVLQDTGSGESANFAYEADISSFRATDALNATTTSPDGNGGNNGGIAAKMIIDETQGAQATAFLMNATIQNGGFTGNADSTAVDYGKTHVVVNQELQPTGQGGNDGAQLFNMDIVTNGTGNWADGSMTILQKGDGAESADFGHTVLAGSYLTAANLGTLTIAHSGPDGGPSDTLDTTAYGAVTATWLSASVPTGVSAYNDFSLNPTNNTAGFGLLVYRGYANNNVATSGLGVGTAADPVFQQAAVAVSTDEIRGFTLSADGGLYNGAVTTPSDLNTAYNTAVSPATGTISSQFTALDATVANPF